MQARLDEPKLGMRRVDQDVVVQSGDDAGRDEDDAAFLAAPLFAESPTGGRRQAVPAGQARRRKHLVGQAPRDGDLDIVLVRRQSPAAADELLQQRRRVMFARIDERASWRVPPSRSERRAGRVEDRMLRPPRLLNYLCVRLFRSRNLRPSPIGSEMAPQAVEKAQFGLGSPGSRAAVRGLGAPG